MTADRSDRNTDERDRDSPHSGVFNWTRLAGFLAALAAASLLLQATEPDPATAERLTAQFELRDRTEAASQRFREAGATEENPLRASLEIRGPDGARESLRAELEKIPELDLVDSSTTDDRLVVRLKRPSGSRMLEVSARLERAGGPGFSVFESRHRTGGWVAILPPLVAVLAALFFRRLVAALLSAVWLGAALQTGFDPVSATTLTVRDYLWGSVADAFSLYIIGFTFCLVGMVHVMIRMGGIAGILESLSSLAESARSTRIATMLMGLALFFDDYANTIVVGSTMRPMTDRQRISREKLAYLVDSTSAPIAGLAVISTWIGYEVGLFGELSAQLGMGISGYGIFFEILPLRFYCILTLVFVFVIAASGRDFGPMRTAEARARRTGDVLRPGSTPLSSDRGDDVEPADDIPLRWYNAVLPVGLVIVAALVGMFWSGWTAPSHPDGIAGLGAVLRGAVRPGDWIGAWAAALPEMTDWRAWRSALSDAANAKVLFSASVLGSFASIALATAQRLLDLRDAVGAWLRTVPMMGLAVAILVLAWAIQGVCADLGTSIYLVGSVQDLVSARALPVLTFGLASVVAFSTGTSWGTMGILLPAMIPLAFHLTADLALGRLLLLMCFGAVLDGAIFGDHCSPISDTTVMSSIASSVDHVDHVRTQFPYAATSMLAAAGFGYVGVAFGLPVWSAYLFGGGTLVAVVYGAGSSTDDLEPE